jgi:hypothetical protein
MLAQPEVAQSDVVGPDVSLPGSELLAPRFFGLLTLVLAVLLVVTLLVLRHRRRRGASARPATVASIVLGVLLVASIVMTAVTWPPPFSTPEFPPLGRLFPEEAFFYRTADDLAVSPDSDRFVAAMGDDALSAGFGGEPRQGVVFGIPFNLVDADAPTEEVRFRNGVANSYRGPYPVTDPAYIESLPTYGFDNHYVALDREAGRMWELLGVNVWFGTWEADAGALWDLDSLDYGRWKTTVSGLPLLPGVLSYDEVAAGRVGHVVWAGAPTISSTRTVWPALDTDGLSDDPDAPPMGSWLRLRADADLSGLGPQSRVIAEGLQRYGIVLADTSGQRFGLRGTADGRWDTEDLRGMGRFTPADFEVVEHQSLMVAADSMAARPEE